MAKPDFGHAPMPDGTTTETVRLTRQVRYYGPDGESVMRVQSVEVEVSWVNGKPEDGGTYREYGTWWVTDAD